MDAGDPVELAIKYADEGADELVFLDITATIEKRKTLIPLVKRIARCINIPFTVGGGINSVETAKELILSGADKITINSSAVRRPELIREIADELGSQAVVLAIDTKYKNDSWSVYIDGGRTPTTFDTLEWAKKAESLGAGEILLTSMNHDGTKNGFALDITNQIAETVNIPVIASGGAGKVEDFYDVFHQTKASAALAASIFHFNEIPLRILKKYLNSKKIAIR
jgi:cyclase